jgi:hypothetical protein
VALRSQDAGWPRLTLAEQGTFPELARFDATFGSELSFTIKA